MATRTHCDTCGLEINNKHKIEIEISVYEGDRGGTKFDFCSGFCALKELENYLQNDRYDCKKHN